jgi:hypothetical protein
MPEDIAREAVEEIKRSLTEVDFQLDEFCYVSNYAQLYVFARCVQQKEIKKNLSFVNL